MGYRFQLLLSKAGIVAGIAIALAATASQGQSVSVRVFADPEVRISYDGDIPHMEAPIAASATEPNMLFAAGELNYPGRSFEHTAAQIYYSHDAGIEWSPVELPIESVNGGWDNALVGGYGGTAYFLTRDDENNLTAYRTHDGGRTWTPALVHTPHTDREYAVVDTSGSRYSGRLYIAQEGFVGYQPSSKFRGEKQDTQWRLRYRDGVTVTSSSDGGRTFNPPVMACYKKGLFGKAYPSPVVLSDGTLVALCSFYLNPTVGVRYQPVQFGVSVSSDGGASFAGYRDAGHPMIITSELTHEQNDERGDFVFNIQVSLAASPRSGLYPNRLYLAWSSFDAPNREVMYLMHSDDRGKTWSKPRAIDPVVSSQNGMIRQAVPMLAVNKDGVVGLAWYDARNASGARGYDIYFTSSADGGETFTSSVRLTSVTSHPSQDGANVVPEPTVIDSTATGELARERTSGGWGPAGETLISFNAPYTTRNIGGDYSTMTADVAGRFHPLWPDARDGTWQLYTSTIRVLRDDQFQEMTASRGVRSCELTSKLHPLVGVPTWNTRTHEMSVAVQIENLSNDVLVDPLYVRVNQGLSWSAGTESAAGWPPASVLDPHTGRYGSSAEFLYSVTSDRPLFPYGVTKPITWRFRVLKGESRAYFRPRVVIIGVAPFCSQ